MGHEDRFAVCVTAAAVSTINTAQHAALRSVVFVAARKTDGRCETRRGGNCLSPIALAVCPMYMCDSNNTCVLYMICVSCRLVHIFPPLSLNPRGPTMKRTSKSGARAQWKKLYFWEHWSRDARTWHALSFGHESFVSLFCRRYGWDLNNLFRPKQR